MPAGRALAGALRRQLSPIVYSSDTVEADGRRVVLRVSSLSEDEELEMLVAAEAEGVELVIEQVGFSHADQDALRIRLDHLRRAEPALGIEVVDHHFDGRVWVSFTGGRDQIAQRLQGIAGDDRLFLHDCAAPHTYRYD